MVDRVLYETCADADFVPHHQGREEILPGHAGWNFCGRQNDRQDARARVPFHETVAVVDVQGVLGKAVGEGGTHQGCFLPANEDGRFTARELVAGESAHHLRDGCVRPGQEGPEGIQEAALRLVLHILRETFPSDIPNELDNPVGMIHGSIHLSCAGHAPGAMSPFMPGAPHPRSLRSTAPVPRTTQTDPPGRMNEPAPHRQKPASGIHPGFRPKACRNDGGEGAGKPAERIYSLSRKNRTSPRCGRAVSHVRSAGQMSPTFFSQSTATSLTGLCSTSTW